MKVYVIIKDNVPLSDCFTSIAMASKVANVSRQTLSKHLNAKGNYHKNGLAVCVCNVVKIKGRKGF